MATTVRQTPWFDARHARGGGGSAPVILDAGESVRVAAIDVGRPLRVGTRFEYGGTMWEITRAQDHSRGWVARPVRVGARCASR